MMEVDGQPEERENASGTVETSAFQPLGPTEVGTGWKDTNGHGNDDAADLYSSRISSPELPLSDKSPSEGEAQDGNDQHSSPEDGPETQDTSFVPDSRPVTPVPSLPPLSSNTASKLGSLCTPSKRLQTPSKLSKQLSQQLSQEHLDQLQAELLTQQDSQAPVNYPEDDSISLQSDLTIADLDPDDWKPLILSCGGILRPDDNSYGQKVHSDKTSRKRSDGRISSRRRTDSNASMRSNHRSTHAKGHRQHGDLTPSRSKRESENSQATETQLQGNGPKIYYGRRRHRSDTKSNAKVYTSQRTSTEDLSGESSCVEVTSARKVNVFRDGRLGDLGAPQRPSASPTRAKSDRKGKGRQDPAIEEAFDEVHDSPSRASTSQLRTKKHRSTPRERVEASPPLSKRVRVEDKQVEERTSNREPTLSPAPPPLKVSKEAFVPLSTVGGARAMSAQEIIAQLIAKGKADAGMESSDEDDKSDQEAEDEWNLDNDLELFKTTDDMDEDDEDLVDTSTLLKNSRNVRPKTAPEQTPDTAATSPFTHTGRSAVQRAADDRKAKKPKSKSSLPPMSKSKYSLDSLVATRRAEQARGWNGIDEASREEAAENLRSSPKEGHPEGSSEAEYDSDNAEDDDVDSDSDLPDAPPKIGENKKEKLLPDESVTTDHLARVAKEMETTKENKNMIEAMKMADLELREAELRAKQRREQEGRSFWKKTKGELRIKPFEPYETEGCKGFDYALREGVLAGLVDPLRFPAELFSPFMTAGRAVRDSISVTYSLYHLIAHPCTDSILANRVLPVLRGLLRKIGTEGSQDTDVDMSCIVTSLCDLGARRESFDGDLAEANDMHVTFEGGTDALHSDLVAFTTHQRSKAVLRILNVVCTLLETRRIPASMVGSVVTLCLRMAVDTQDHHLREAALRTLSCTLETLQDAPHRISVIQSVLLFAAALPVRDRYAIGTFWPLHSVETRSMMKSICFGMLLGNEKDESSDFDTELPMKRLLSLVTSRKSGSVFHISDTAEASHDSDLYYSVLTLQLLLTDMSTALVSDVYSTDEAVLARAQEARQDTQALINAVQDVESRLRANPKFSSPMRNKAKNALVRVQHSMEYQLQAATKRADKIALQRRLGNHTLAKATNGKIGNGQMSLAGFFKVQERASPLVM